MATYEFNGISTEQFNPTDRTDKFYEMYDGTLIEKEPFTVELENKDIELHLYIQDIDMAEYEDSTDHIISVGVVPTLKSLSQSNQNSILEQYDIPEDREKLKEDIAWQLEDIISYGMGIELRSVTVSDLDKVEHTINSAIAIRHAISGLIGFELDRCKNAIGNTGWDFLEDYCEDKDLIQMAIAKQKVIS